MSHECSALLLFLLLLVCGRLFAVIGLLDLFTPLFNGSRLHQCLETFVVLHKLLESVNGLNLAILHPDNAVTSAKDPELMSGQNTALILEKAKNSVIEDVASDMSVDGAERIVHEYDVGIEVNSSGNVKTLLLTTRDGNTTFTNLRHITVGEHINIRLKGTTKRRC